MSFFACCKSQDKNAKNSCKKSIKDYHNICFKYDSGKRKYIMEEIKSDEKGNITSKIFSYHELCVATKNFHASNMVGEGGFGRVYKGRIKSIDNKVVAVKKLNKDGFQGTREFLAEVMILSFLHHSNLVNLVGYCSQRDQKILVYEYMANGSLEDHLFELPQNKKPLDWYTRMKIAEGAAKGLEYLHAEANPPVIYRDFKSSNILLDENFNPKLSDFGLAKLGPTGDKSHVSTRVMGTYGYCAPEYASTGQLTTKSDVYSFGVVFLEMITGRRVLDYSRSSDQHNLVNWALPLFKNKRKYASLVDPSLKGNYPTRGLLQALAIAAMCLLEDANARPLIGDVVTALGVLAMRHVQVGKQKNTKETCSEQGEGSLQMNLVD
ncbi:unnamed protein product [Lathyrus sativus]|nr:unnamed protein product [Lathyrus sativus]